MLKGIGASPGLAKAPALKYVVETPMIPCEPVTDTEAELEHFQRACSAVRQKVAELYEQARQRAGEAEANIFSAHLELLSDDASLIRPIERAIMERKDNAAMAAGAQFDQIIIALEQVEDEYVRQRAADIRDLRTQLIRELLQIHPVELSRLERPVIILAKDLAPSDTLKLDLEHLNGIICEEGGKTSHVAILATAMGIPTILGCHGILDAVKEGELVLMDGASGDVICSPSPDAVAEFDQRMERQRQEQEVLNSFLKHPALTADGHKVLLCANIARPEECAEAVKRGAEGVGLFRSEFLYMDATGLPDEETQFRAYRAALEGSGGRHVTIRTLDAGGDKGIAALSLPPEENPFLGYRAIRISLDRRDLFQTQLRALYRASAYGALRIMFPMISSMDELRQAKAEVERAKSELKKEGIAYAEDVPVGIMVEIPAVAVMADQFAKEVDFFSIGTNDLTQYTVAVDRGNQSIEALYSHYHPAVIRLIAHSIRSAQENHISCCMCGEAAGDPLFVPLLIGLGLGELSMSASKILRMKRDISLLKLESCENLVQEVFKASTASQVEALLKAFYRSNMGDQ